VPETEERLTQQNVHEVAGHKSGGTYYSELNEFFESAVLNVFSGYVNQRAIFEQRQKYSFLPYLQHRLHFAYTIAQLFGGKLVPQPIHHQREAQRAWAFQLLNQ
jgi:hypothetical protein